MNSKLHFRGLSLALALVLAVDTATAMAPNTPPRPAASTLSVEDRLKACDPAVATAAAHEVLNDPGTRDEPITWFLPAYTLYRHGQRDEALFWFYAAQLRARYQIVFEKGDHPQLLSVMLMTVGQSINNHGFAHPELLVRTFDRVLAWDARTPNPWSARPRTPAQEAEIAKIYSGLAELRRKVEREGPALKTQAENQAKQFDELLAATACKPGQMDPSLLRQARRKEAEAVEQWVARQAEVVRAAVAVQRVSVYSYRGENTMPYGYALSVNGTRKVYVDLTVDRTTTPARYAITCISPIFFSNRDLRGPDCPQ